MDRFASRLDFDNGRGPEGVAAVGPSLDDGERAVIAMALQRSPRLVLMDDRAGMYLAQAMGLVVIGTLGVLVRAARQGLIDLDAAFEALGRTSFHWTPVLRQRLLLEHRCGSGRRP